MAVRKGREGRGLAQLGQLLKPLHLGGRVGAVVEAGAGPCWAGLPPVGDAQSGSQAVPKALRCVCGVCLCAKARRKGLVSCHVARDTFTCLSPGHQIQRETVGPDRNSLSERIPFPEASEGGGLLSFVGLLILRFQAGGGAESHSQSPHFLPVTKTEFCCG